MAPLARLTGAAGWMKAPRCPRDISPGPRAEAEHRCSASQPAAPPPPACSQAAQRVRGKRKSHRRNPERQSWSSSRAPLHDCRSQPGWASPEGSNPGCNPQVQPSSIRAFHPALSLEVPEPSLSRETEACVGKKKQKKKTRHGCLHLRLGPLILAVVCGLQRLVLVSVRR